MFITNQGRKRKDVCGRQNNTPHPTPKMSTSKYLWCYICQRIKVANRVKFANQLTLRWVNYPGLSRWTWWCNHNGFVTQKREAEKEQSDTPWGRLSLLLLALKMEVGQELRNVGNGRSQKRQVNTFPHRASRVEFSPANALISALGLGGRGKGETHFRLLTFRPIT